MTDGPARKRRRRASNVDVLSPPEVATAWIQILTPHDLLKMRLVSKTALALVDALLLLRGGMTALRTAIVLPRFMEMVREVYRHSPLVTMRKLRVGKPRGRQMVWVHEMVCLGVGDLDEGARVRVCCLGYANSTPENLWFDQKHGDRWCVSKSAISRATNERRSIDAKILTRIACVHDHQMIQRPPIEISDRDTETIAQHLASVLSDPETVVRFTTVRGTTCEEDDEDQQSGLTALLYDHPLARVGMEFVEAKRAFYVPARVVLETFSMRERRCVYPIPPMPVPL
jgi:hypothetical protein